MAVILQIINDESKLGYELNWRQLAFGGGWWWFRGVAATNFGGGGGGFVIVLVAAVNFRGGC